MNREWDDYESDERLPTIPQTWNNQKLFQTVDIPTFVLMPQSPAVVVKPRRPAVVVKPQSPDVSKKTTNSFMLLNTESGSDSDSDSN